jgi:hypothetical protein
MPSLLRELRSEIKTVKGDAVRRVQMEVFDLDDDAQFEKFAKGESRQLKIYGTDKYTTYDPMKRIGVAISKMGASKAISVGAYAFALSQLDSKK